MTGGNNSTTSGSASQGSRAVEAALSATAPFRPRAGASAMRTGTRHAERWAPEGRSAKRPRSLGALAFADTILSPYVESAGRLARTDMFGAMPSVGGGAVEREIEAASWVFPRPWYMDELSWLAAARATSSGYRPSVGSDRALSATRGRAPVGATSVSAPLPLELIAPSYVGTSRASDPFLGRVASTRMPGQAHAGISGLAPADSSRGIRTGRANMPVRSGAGAVTAAPMGASLRAWSPLVSFPAAQAAEIMQAVAHASSPTGRSSATMADEAWALFEYVAPSDVTEREREMHVSERVRGRMERAVARAAQRREALAVRPSASASASATPAREVRPQTTTLAGGDSRAPAQASSPAREARPATSLVAPIESSTGATAAASSELRRSSVATSAVELLRRSIAAGGAAIESVAGPRVALPSGLGGAVVGLRTAQSLTRPLITRGAWASAPLFVDRNLSHLSTSGVPAVARSVDAPARADIRPNTDTSGYAVGAGVGDALVSAMPSSNVLSSGTEGLLGLSSDYRPATSAYRSVTGNRPRGMQHLAWSDRWLARFAGASNSTLSRFDASTGNVSFNVLSSEAVARNAPTPVFISGDILSLANRAGSTSPAFTAPHVVVPTNTRPGIGRETAAVATHSTRNTAQVGVQSQKPIPKTSALVIGDNESVSDEVFAAIAAATALPASADARREAARSRDPRDQQASERERARRIDAAARVKRGSVARQDSDPAASAVGMRTVVGRSLVDRVLDFGPVAPGPGMRSALAASPIASALNAIVPMPATRSFDVRAVSGDSLAYAYLLGAVEPDMRFVGSAERAAMVGSHFGSPDRQISLGRPDILEKLSLSAPESAFVAPLAPSSSTVAEQSTAVGADAGHVQRALSVDTPGQPSSAALAFRSQTAQAGVPSGAVSGELAATSTTQGLALDVMSPLLPTAEIRALQLNSLSPLSRTASVAAAASSALTAPTWGLSTTEAMTSFPGGAGYAFGPGQAGTRAQAWSVEHERASADLAFDFVAPELVAAARIYGFGPAEANQASRLSVAGTAGLNSLASAVDLSFIDTFEDVHSRPVHSSSSESARAGEQARMRKAAVSGTRQVSAGSPPRVSDMRSPGISTGSPVGLENSAGSVTAASVVRSVASQTGQDRTAAEANSSPTFADTTFTTAQAMGGTPASTAWFNGVHGRVTSGRIATESASATTSGIPDAPFRSSGRRPRGAFLWPKAVIAALGLDSFEAGDEPPVSLAALDLLAARAVANVGIFVAPDGTPMTFAANDAPLSLSDGRPAQAGTSASSGAYANVLAASMERPLVAPDSDAQQLHDVSVETRTPAMNRYAEASTSYSEGARATLAGMGIVVDTPEEAVAIVSTVGASRVPREFHSLYVALSRSSAGRSMSPAVRAARALALSQSIDAGTSSTARARAAAAWAVLPTVIPSMEFIQGAWPQDLTGDVSGSGSNLQIGASGADSSALASASSALRPDGYRPVGELGPVYLAGGDWAGLDRATTPSSAATGTIDPRAPEPRIAASRAGESLRSLVTPYSEYQQSKASERSAARGAVMRAPTAAPPLVQTGGSAASVAPERAAMQQMISAARSKRASGDVSIPSWFEKAARQMFEHSSDGGISLAEMTLIATAPVSQVAASPKTASASPAAAPTNAGGTENEGAQAAPDVEAMALEVYTEIIRLMEVSRERNGEPWR